MFKQPDRSISVVEGHELEHEPSRLIDSKLVSAPVGETIFAVLLQHGQSFVRRFIDVLLTRDLLKYPWFDQCATRDHTPIHSRSHVLVPVFESINIAITQERHRCIVPEFRASAP